MADLIHRQLSYKLNGIFYNIQNSLGKELKEKQYADALELSFKKDKIKYLRDRKLRNIRDSG